MHAQELLHEAITESCTFINQATLKRLLSASNSLLHGAKLSLSHIGRNLIGKAQVKSKIKAINYLLGNHALYHQRASIYKTIASLLISKEQSINVLIDWSPCGHRKQQLLRASIAHPTKCVTLYEEVHNESTEKGRRRIEFEFLNTLKTIIPSEVDVTITTDAGFRCPWFNHVLSLGWNFIGRVRAQAHFSHDNKVFLPIKRLHACAKYQPKHIGHVKLTKSNRLSCHMYIVKEKLTKTKKITKPILSSAASKKYHAKEVSRTRKKAQEPWIIVTSHQHRPHSPHKTILLYKDRMKIEHDFRTSKNIRWGMGLDYARSHDNKRLEVLLLIGSIAIFILWLIGLAAEKENLHLQFQANTIKHRRVLSLVFLGSQILRHNPDFVSLKRLQITKEQLI